MNHIITDSLQNLQLNDFQIQMMLNVIEENYDAVSRDLPTDKEERDAKSHEIQNEIDLTMDMIRESPLESETILKKLVEIRDSIPCSCGSELDLPEEKLTSQELKDLLGIKEDSYSFLEVQNLYEGWDGWFCCVNDCGETVGCDSNDMFRHLMTHTKEEIQEALKQ